MTNETINFKASANFTDAAMQVAGQDPFIINGTVLFMDFLNALCNPNADGALTTAAVFVNMVDGAASPTLTGNTGFSNRPGKLGLESLGTANFLQMPLGSLNFRQAAAPDHAFMVTMWRKVPSAGMTTANFTNILKLAPAADVNASSSQFSIDSGTGGVQIRRQVGNNGTTTTTNQQDNAVLDSIEQFGMSFDPVTGLQGTIHNGVYTSTVSGVTLPFRLQDAINAYLRLSGGYKQRTFVLAVEDLTISGSSAAEVAAADYAYRLPILTAAGA